jgi:phage terminase large subunit-like protein
MSAFDISALTRFRVDPTSFIQTVLIDPETNEPFVLSSAEKWFLKFAFQLNDDGRLRFPELVFGAIKKSGKTGFAAMIILTMLLLFGGRFAEGYCVANDLEQAQSRVFQACRRIVEASPLLKREARITQDKITFPGFYNAVISAIANDYAGAAGANPTIVCFDESWGIISERGYRLFDEMVPSPARQISCRLTVSYAGFSGESVLLENLYKQGMSLPEVGPNLRAGDGMLFAWHHLPTASWQTDSWLAEMRRSLRPAQYLRMTENRWVTSESTFIGMPAWDRVVDPSLTPVIADHNLPVWIGVDASTKHDSTAVVAVTFARKTQQVLLVSHKVFQPSPDCPLDFEAAVEGTLLDLKKRFRVRAVLYDPWQMQASAQRLTRAGLPIEEFPQSSPNLTAASQNLYELITGNNLVVYPDEAMRLAISRAIATETPRGWKISKEKQSHKIDVVVALGMACYAAVQAQSKNVALDYAAMNGTSEADPHGVESWRAARLASYINSFNPNFGGGRWR